MQVLINIDVPDLQLAERLYRDAFGLRSDRRLGPHALELLGAESPIYLLENAARSDTAGARRDYARHWTPIHLDVVVDDLAAALERALGAGLAQEGAVRDESWGRIVQLADPWGHGWCLLQFTGRGYDEITT